MTDVKEIVVLHGGEMGGNIVETTRNIIESAEGNIETTNWPQNTVLQFETFNYERRGDIGIFIGESIKGQPLPPVP